MHLISKLSRNLFHGVKPFGTLLQTPIIIPSKTNNVAQRLFSKQASETHRVELKDGHRNITINIHYVKPTSVFARFLKYTLFMVGVGSIGILTKLLFDMSDERKNQLIHSCNVFLNRTSSQKSNIGNE